METRPGINHSHDHLYARAWECENEKPVSDNDHDISATSKSPEKAVQFKLAADKTSTIPGTIREGSPEISPQAVRSCDGTDRYHYMEPVMRMRAWNSLTLHLPTCASPCMVYIIIQNRIVIKTTHVKLLFRPTMVYRTHTYTFQKS